MVQPILSLSRPQKALAASAVSGIVALATQKTIPIVITGAFLTLAIYFSAQKTAVKRDVTVLNRQPEDLNRALDKLFVDIHKRTGSDMSAFLATFKSLVNPFIAKVKPLGAEERKKFQKEYNKFQLLKQLIENPTKKSPESELFTKIAQLQIAVKTVGSETQFKSYARELRLLVEEAKSSKFVFASLINVSLEEIRQTLLKSAFHKASSKKNVPSPKTYANVITPKQKPEGVIYRSTPYLNVTCGDGNDPIFTDANKKNLHTHLTGGKYRPKDPFCFCKMKIDKKEAAKLKLQKKGDVSFVDGPMTHRSSKKGSFKVWVSNFADRDLFLGSMNGLFAQDEIQTAEHPGMQNLRRTLLDLDPIDSKPVAILQDDEVAIIEDVERRGRFNSFNGIYGQKFPFADWSAIESQCTKIAPTKSNIIAFRAPDMGTSKKGKLYTREDLAKFFYQALGAGLAIKSNTSPVEKTVWEMGLIGTGAFGNSIPVSLILQLGAAKFAGIDVVNFFPFNHRTEVLAAYKQYQKIESALAGKSPEDFLNYLFVNREKLNLRYGASDGN